MKGPEGKYLFGTVKLGEKGQILIPKEAREVFGLKPGDQLLLIGDVNRGMALVDPETLGIFGQLPNDVYSINPENGKTPEQNPGGKGD